jgi:hypothetical protein
MNIGCSLEEAIINSDGEYTVVPNSAGLTFSVSYDAQGQYYIATQNRGAVTKETLKNSCFKLKFSFPSYLKSSEIYAKNIQIFKEKRDKRGRLITPDDVNN